jgi:hypothetical protein
LCKKNLATLVLAVCHFGRVTVNAGMLISQKSARRKWNGLVGSIPGRIWVVWLHRFDKDNETVEIARAQHFDLTYKFGAIPTTSEFTTTEPALL